MKDRIIDKYLSSYGYLPPRNEEEMMTFEDFFSNVKVDRSFHVDVKSIVSGNSCTIDHPQRQREVYHIAARNYERIPDEIIDKIRKQHNNNGE